MLNRFSTPAVICHLEMVVVGYVSSASGSLASKLRFITLPTFIQAHPLWTGRDRQRLRVAEAQV